MTSLFLVLLICALSLGAKPLVKFSPKNTLNKELRFIELKAKKEIADKKNSNIKKYTVAILAAREFRSIEEKNKSLEFYKLAQEIKTEIDKKEVIEAISKRPASSYVIQPFYFESDIKELIKNKLYEKAILSINPEALKLPENESLRIVYDLLNVKIKKLSVRKLYCIDNFIHNVENENYNSILCDYLNEYLKAGKKDNDHMAYIEEYFLKKDLNERYLLNLIHEL